MLGVFGLLRGVDNRATVPDPVLRGDIGRLRSSDASEADFDFDDPTDFGMLNVLDMMLRFKSDARLIDDSLELTIFGTLADVILDGKRNDAALEMLAISGEKLLMGDKSSDSVLLFAVAVCKACLQRRHIINTSP